MNLKTVDSIPVSAVMIEKFLRRYVLIGTHLGVPKNFAFTVQTTTIRIMWLIEMLRYVTVVSNYSFSAHLTKYINIRKPLVHSICDDTILWVQWSSRVPQFFVAFSMSVIWNSCTFFFRHFFYLKRKITN